MKTTWVIVAILTVLVLAGLLLIAIRSRQKTQAVSDFTTQRQQAIETAKTAYEKAKIEVKDLEAGPCLGVVAPNWVADVAHDPRQPVDNLKENQCEQFINRTVEHFVELDPSGKVIRAL